MDLDIQARLRNGRPNFFDMPTVQVDSVSLSDHINPEEISDQGLKI